MIATMALIAPGSFAGSPAWADMGEPVFCAANLPAFGMDGKEPQARFSVVDVTGPAFGQAIRVEVRERTPDPWGVQLRTPTSTRPLKKGEHLLAIVNVRCTDGAGMIAAYIHSSVPAWASICSTDARIGREWKTLYLHGRAKRDARPGEYGLVLHLGLQPQTLEFGGITLLNLGTEVDERKLPFTALTYPGQEPHAPWRKAAQERIEKHRKADLIVAVVDRNGGPVNGATVHVQMQRHAYGFGTFLDYRPASDSGPDADRLRQWTLKLFNRCTTPIYWADWGWANPENRVQYLETAQWAQDRHLPSRGHCIIYPGWQFLPAEVLSLTNNPPALRKRLLEQVIEVTDATRKFGFAEYDVCNELRHLTEIHGLLGKDAVAEWFEVARAHAPGSKMAINENTILTKGGMTRTEQDNYAEWIQYLIDEGQGPDVIGMQGHFDEALTDPATVFQILERFSAFGKPIQITEFDINTRDEAGQARYTRDFLTAVFSHPATEAFTVWGFWEKKMWQPQGAFFHTDWTPKPNLQVWEDLIYKQWWTDATLTTGRDGTCRIRGFLGDYTVTATTGSRQQSIPAKLISPSTAITITLN
jgi:endo-1,4-beta-xylanase